MHSGSLQIKNNKYYVVINYYAEGKRKQKWINTGCSARTGKKKMEVLLEEYLRDYDLERNCLSSESIQNGQHNIISKNTPIKVVDFIQQWLEEKKNSVKLNTWENYESCVKSHIIPYFLELDLDLNEIHPLHIKEYYRIKSEKFVQDTLGKHAGILKSIFLEAVMLELIPKNPAEHVKVPVAQKQSRLPSFLSVEEANQLLVFFQDDLLLPIVYMALYYGLRRSEIVGLKWKAIDFEQNTFSIEHTVVRTKTLIQSDQTKTVKSAARYHLIAELREMLLHIQQQQQQNEILFRSPLQDSAYVFLKQDGSLMNLDFVSKHFRRVLKNNHFKSMRFHDLRHSCASMLHDRGWSLKDIQVWLRHSKIETTGNIYTHISEHRKKTLSQDMEHTLRLTSVRKMLEKC